MSLSSLIVQREVATIRQVEEALARQVLYGGDLVTNILEVADVPERVLVSLLAETSHMPHAPLGPLPPPSPEARALVPLELAIRRSILPLDLSAGLLVVAVAEALDSDLLQELSFALGVRVEQRVAPLVRIREALAAHYGAPLDRRMARLIGRLGGREATVSSSLPPLLRTNPHMPFQLATHAPAHPPGLRRETPKIGSLQGVRQETHRTNTSFPALAPRDAEPAPIPRTITSTATPAPPPSALPDSAPPASATPPIPTPRNPTPPIPTPPTPPARISDAVPARRSTLPPGSQPSSLVRQMQLASANPRTGRRRRGPITLERAKLELEQATERDALLDLFFDFSLQFFEYTALFIAHGDLAEGRDAYGPGATRHKVLGVGVPLDIASALSAARDRSAPVIAKPAKEGLDAVLVEDLERSPDWSILVVPLVVRGRTVALLYGDNGEMGVDGAGSEEVTAFAVRVGQAFERVIVRRKLAGFAGDKPTAGPRVDSTRVAAKALKPADPEVRAATLRKALIAEGLAPTSSRPPAALEGSRPGRAPRGLPWQAEAPPLGQTILAEPREEGARKGALPDEMVGPPSTRRTILDLTPPFAASWGESAPSAAGEFIAMPPPPQVVVVRPLSGPPIPREDPPALALDLTPPRRRVSGPPTIDVGHLEEADEEELLRELEVLAPGNSALDLVEAAGLTEEDDDSPSGPVSSAASSHASSGGAPPSHALAFPPHTPPPRRGRPDTLPTVIVDVDNAFSPLVDRLAADPSDEHAEAELLRQGQHAMLAIMARFPGPITLSPAEIEEKKARVGECGPILRLIAGQRRVALPFVLARVNATNPDERFWATFLLTELAYPEAVPAIVARLFDEEERTRKVARLAARVVGESAREALVAELDRIVHDPRAEVEDRVAIMQTLGELRDSAVVPVVVGFVDADSDAVADAAWRALCVVSQQDFGTDKRRWLAWWSSNSSRHRVEWLIDALTHDRSAIRKAAAEELKTITREYFGYYEDLPKRERERAQQRYRDWWRSEGRWRFRWG